MLKKLCLFICLSMGASLAHAQAISAVKFSVTEGLTGQPVEVWPEFSGPQSSRGGECALFISFGDGGTQQVKIDPAKPPVKAGHIYQTAGNFTVTIEGKTIFRGFNSTSACDGNAHSATLTVRDAKVAAQEAEKKAAAERASAVDPTARLLVLAQVAAQAGVAAQKAGQNADGLDARAQAQATREFDNGLGKLNAGQLFALADQLNAQNLPDYARMALRKLVIQYSEHPLAATAAKMLADSATAKAPAPASPAAAAPAAPAKAGDAEARVIQQQEEEMQRLAAQRAQAEKTAAPSAAKPVKKLTPEECTVAVKKATVQVDAVEKAAPWDTRKTTNKPLEAKFTLYAYTEALALMEQGCKFSGIADVAQAKQMRDEGVAECKKYFSKAEDCVGKKPW